MVNNFELIKSILQFRSEDDFYHLQIIKRKKENPEIGSNSYVIKTYYITSESHLEKLFPEIVNLCEFNNARACINLNRRSFERIAFHVLKKVTDQIMNKDFKSARKAYESVCGEYSADPEKKWIIDIDNFDEIFDREVQMYIASLQPIGAKVIANIPTKHGHHLICSPFRLDEFKQKYSELDIHKDNPTILYIP
jgi:hypothetical protein